MIEKYDFGCLQIDGQEYRRDVIIYPGSAPGPARVDATWWRQEGHRLDKADLDAVVQAKPEVLIVGTGYYGCLKLPPETVAFLHSLQIELFAGVTKDACEKYNQLKDSRRVVAALHLTC